ncbi:MAG: sugar transferase [Muribaculaceae bacterium]|nr:sugar transferase [Muribaculaceae bacterium]
MISESQQRLRYVLGDFVSSNIAWFAYNCLRYTLGVIEGQYESLSQFIIAPMVVVGQLVFPVMMMAVYCLSGYYNVVFRKSRLQEVAVTFWSALVNALLIFFVALINDVMKDRGSDYEMLLLLWALLFFVVYVVRALITAHTSRKIRSREWGFNTLIVGRGTAAVAFVDKMNNQRDSLGYRVKGFVSIPGESDAKGVSLPCYTLDEVAQACRDEKIEEIIVVPTRHEESQVLTAINRLFALDLPIKMIPDRSSSNVLLSQVRISDMYGDPLVNISGSNMSESGKNVKRCIDVVVSVILLVLLLPFFAVMALLIKLDSPGTVFYRQERMGYHNVPFNIIKFRSMRADAEHDSQPQLSSENDPRITRVGHFMRKYRIDELPQFWNVLVGEMSIVGPRPERKYYVNQILERVPAYALLHQVRPGITSMGMVKFGYARNVDEMVERLSYDLLYLENMSLINDLKIMVYTVKTVLTGRGM